MSSAAAFDTFSTKMTDPKLDTLTDITYKKLQGKVAIVTGGASGIGEATARKFAMHGARAVVIADIQDDKGQNVVASIGPNLSTYIRCDVSDEEQVKALIETTVKTYGRLDIMFSNAGVCSASLQTVLELDLGTYDRLMAINVRGMAACVKHAAKAMVEGRVRGSIVCTTSVAASVGMTIFTDYTMSKHAVLGLVRSASLQLGTYGIRVNCLSPGPVKTPLLSPLIKLKAEDLQKLFGSQIGLSEEKMISVDSIADGVVFLASDEAEFVSGHNLVVDGGFKT